MVKNKGQSSVVSLFFSLTTRRRREKKKRRARRRRKRRRKRQRRTRRRVNCARRIGVVSPRNRTKGKPVRKFSVYRENVLRVCSSNAYAQREKKKKTKKKKKKNEHAMAISSASFSIVAAAVLFNRCRADMMTLNSVEDEI